MKKISARNTAAIALTLVAGLALAARTPVRPLSEATKSSKADAVTVKLAPKVGVAKYKYSLETSVQGQVVTVNANLSWDVKKVEAERVDIESTWNDLKIELGGNPFAAEVNLQKISLGLPQGAPISIAGGIQGTDEQRSALVIHFIAPKDAISEGDSYTYEAKADEKNNLPAFKFVGKYEGKTELKGKPALKFTAKYSEPGADTMSATSTFWVREDGTVLKVQSEFKEMPLPQVGASIDGKSIFELVD